VEKVTGRGRRRTVLVACFAAALGSAAGFVFDPALAVPGDGEVARIGGQGFETTCWQSTLTPEGTLVPQEILRDDGSAPLLSARYNSNNFGGINSIAVDGAGGNVFVPEGDIVRGSGGRVAGVRPPSAGSGQSAGVSNTNVPPPLTGPAAENADPKKVQLSPIGVAVDPLGDNLYILEDTGAVRWVRDPGRPQATIRTVAGAQVGTPLDTQGAIAADKNGHVYIGDRKGPGLIRRLDVDSKTLTSVGKLATGVASLAVDAGGTQLFAVAQGPESRGTATTVQRIDLQDLSMTTVAGSPTGTDQDGVLATTVALSPNLAVAVDPMGSHLYIAEAQHNRVRIVDLTTRTINTIIGTGQSGHQDSGKAASLALGNPTGLAVDLYGDVFVLLSNDCAILKAQKPVVIFEPPVDNPPAGPPNNVKPDDPKTIPDPKETPGPGAATNNVTPQPGGSSTAADPKTAIINSTPSNAVNPPAPNSATPANAPVGDGGVTQAVTPGPAPVGPVASPNPGPGGVLGPPVAPQPVGAPPPAAPVSPAAGAPAPVPVPAPPPAAGPAAGTSPPPAAPHPVANVGLAGPGGDAPTPKGAARYAMVRADEDSSTATLAVAVGALALAAFLCVLFVAPGASSRPKPRPKGAY
jgi:hypothetical protein